MLAAAGLYAAESTPKELAGIEINPVLGAQVPLDLVFQDHTGKSVKLRDYFDGTRPVILVMNYYRCPMLCGVILNTTRDSLQEINWRLGEKYQIVAVSIDPREKPELAAAKRRSVLGSIGDSAFRAAAEKNWHFLVGQGDAPATLAKAVGFGYEYDEKTKEYAHGAALFFVSGKGVLSRVLFGIEYLARDLKLALLEAGQGKVGTLAEKILLFCYHFDPKGNKYAIFAVGLMKVAGAITVAIILLAYLFVYLRSKKERTRNS